MSALDTDLQALTQASDPAQQESLEQSVAGKMAADADAVVLRAENGDVGAPFEPASLSALCALKAQDAAGWMRLRERLKNTSVSVTELDKYMQSGSGGSPTADDQSLADKLIELARRQCDLMHDAQQELFAVFEFAGARQVYSLSSRGFSEFLSHQYYAENDRAPTESSLKVALATLRGQAQFDGELCEVFTRIAKTKEGYWVDLCNDAWQCVLITPQGWSVRSGEGCPLFTRSASMRPLPNPVRGGTMDLLWPLVNIPKSEEPMILAWLLECLRPETPHVVLELIGEQGSVKSTTQRFLRRLIDPNQADLRSAPKSVEDVWISARNSLMVSLENLSHLAPAYQDALCVLATGGAYTTRTLYTNTEETIIELRKPIVLNGISVIVTAQDLLDRCLHFDLPVVKDRRLASDIDRQFDQACPKLVGALLDLFANVLAALPHVHIEPDQRPRMADFALLGEALFKTLGKPAGNFLRTYNDKRRQGVYRTIDASPVGTALISHFGGSRRIWRGTLTELLLLLEPYKPHGDAWPKSAKGLGDAVRRVAPALRQIGFKCQAGDKTGGVIQWEIECSQQSPASPTCPDDAGGSAVANAETGLAGHSGHDVVNADAPGVAAGLDEVDSEIFR